MSTVDHSRIDLASIRENLSLQSPTTTSTGLSRTSCSYYLWIKEERESVKAGIYKPRLQVSGASDHPISPNAAPARKGIPAGTEAFRERLAYALSEELDQSLHTHPQLMIRFRIPPTIICGLQHELFGENHKSGSLQKYVNDHVGLDSLDNSDLNTIPLNELYKTAIIDLIFLNTDRHLGNLLFSMSNKQISLIDHGGCFPGFKSLQDLCFGWNYIDFVKAPLPPEWITFIQRIDTRQLTHRAIQEIIQHSAQFPNEQMEISGEALFAMIYAIESLKGFTCKTPTLPLIEYVVHMMKESRRFGIIKDNATKLYTKVVEADLEIKNNALEERLRSEFPTHDITVQRKDVGGEFSRNVQNAFTTVFSNRDPSSVTALTIWSDFDQLHSFIVKNVTLTPVTPYHELLLKKLNKN